MSAAFNLLIEINGLPGLSEFETNLYYLILTEKQCLVCYYKLYTVHFLKSLFRLCVSKACFRTLLNT